MGRVTSFVYDSSLLVVFRFDFSSRVYGLGLRIMFYRWPKLVGFTSRDYGSYVAWSNFMIILCVLFSVRVYERIYGSIVAVCLRDKFTIDFIG